MMAFSPCIGVSIHQIEESVIIFTVLAYIFFKLSYFRSLPTLKVQFFLESKSGEKYLATWPSGV